MKLLDLGDLAFRILPMTAEHIPSVAAIERDTFGSPWPESAFFQEVVHNPFSAYLILKTNATPQNGRSWLRRAFGRNKLDPSIIGYGGYWQMVDEAHICTLAIRQDWRGRGLGELVLLSLITCSMELNVERLSLEVRASNKIAQTLYAKYGFKQVGERKGYYSDNHEDALIMTTDNIHAVSFKSRIAIYKDALLKRISEETQPQFLHTDKESENAKEGEDE